MLNETVRAGRGSLEITADGVQYSLGICGGATFSLRSKIPGGGTTLVDFQLKATDSISLEDIVGESGRSIFGPRLMRTLQTSGI